MIDRIRPWLPVLLALSANSPYWLGVDYGVRLVADAGVAALAGGRPVPSRTAIWPATVARRMLLDCLWGCPRSGDALPRCPVSEHLPDGRDPGQRRVHGGRRRVPGRCADPCAGRHGCAGVGGRRGAAGVAHGPVARGALEGQLVRAGPRPG